MKRLGKLHLKCHNVPVNFIFLFPREAIKEDDSGRIQSSVDEIVYKSIRKRILNQKNVRLGMVGVDHAHPNCGFKFSIHVVFIYRCAIWSSSLICLMQ